MKPEIAFTKMSGAGNDFVVLDTRTTSELLDRPDWIRAICRRGLSVGADGVLFVSPVGDGHVRVDFRNPDGSRAFCGNGSRCAARFAHSRGMCGARVTLDTEAGSVEAELHDGHVSLHLSAPEDRGPLRLEASARAFEARLITAGVPHLVVEVPDVRSEPLAEWGPVLRRHPALGSVGANVNLVAHVGCDTWAIRTWERGVEGETLACGSAAVAAAFHARLQGAGDRLVMLPASGIPLEVRFSGARDTPDAAILTGDARFVFDGLLHAEADFEPSPRA